MKRPIINPLRAAALAAPLVLFAAEPASASPAYPDLVKELLKLSDDIDCGLCHESKTSGGIGTLNDKVGDYLKNDLSLTPGLSKDKLGEILEKWKDTQDSDGDDAPDVDELKADTDPNDDTDKPDGGAGGAGGKGGSSGAGGKGGSSGTGGKGGSSGKGGSGGTNGGDGNVATSAGCSYAPAPGGGWAPGGLALAGLSVLRRRARRAVSRPRP